MLLLDTHAVIWLAEGEPLSRPARNGLADAISARGILVSAVSAWEIGLLHAGGRRVFHPNPERWLDDLEAKPGIRLVALDHRMALLSQSLPEPFHRDPADRFLLATAMVLDVPLVTRDERIIAYGQRGHVRVLPC